MLTHFRVGQVYSEKLVTGGAKAVEVEVQAPRGVVADLHCGEVGVACESQRSQVFRGGWLTVELGNRDGHD